MQFRLIASFIRRENVAFVCVCVSFRQQGRPLVSVSRKKSASQAKEITN